ncbi:MAG TPA: sugar phosphate isomerase/epimerase family protein [Candidatus Saccharimonadales bacterium]|nr:sugar phosphate isomerase/epimerase family protein [Candidatus Saccharimonadales bacterium]
MRDRPSTERFPIGVSTWVWTSPVTDASLADLAERVAAMGFDILELPFEALDDWDPGRAADVLGRLDLAATTCAVMTPDRDLTTTDSALTRATQAYLTACIERSAVVGSTVVAGPMYAPVGRTWREDAAARRGTIGRLIEALRPLADSAGEHGVRLAIEPLNRFETSLINTVDQALEVVEGVDSDALGICLDTFHMNIEERDPAAAVARAAGRIAHVQACGTDRGAPGGDRFEWSRFVTALRASGYDGPVCIESFTPDNDAIARAAAIWRPLAESPDRLAMDGLAFLRGALHGAALDGVAAAPVSRS